MLSLCDRGYKEYRRGKERGMTLFPINTEQKQQIENYLRGYSVNRKLLRMDRYHKEFMGGGQKDALGSPDREMLNEVPLARA